MTSSLWSGKTITLFLSLLWHHYFTKKNMFWKVKLMTSSKFHGSNTYISILKAAKFCITLFETAHLLTLCKIVIAVVLKVYKILKIIIIRTVCTCGFRTCTCPETGVLLCQPYTCIMPSKYCVGFASQVPINLHAKCPRIVPKSSVVGIPPSDVTGKCILLESGTTTYAINVPTFEMDWTILCQVC